jgi:putative ABC transport system ATP-binding protein
MQLQLRNISLRLGDKVIFQNFNLDLREGEKLLIKGSSGRGKSSLLRIILGFVHPDEGEVLVDGVPLSRENIWAVRRRMGFVSQELTFSSGKVRDLFRDVYGYRANRHLKMNEAEILARFKLFDLESDKLDQNIEKLSGGEKQRVALILALLLDRELYLLDEVTSAMNEDLGEKVIRHLARLEGKTMIVVSHAGGWEKQGFRELVLDNLTF